MVRWTIVLVGLGACAEGPQSPPPVPAELSSSEAVAVLRADTSAYHLIYHPAVDLTKR